MSAPRKYEHLPALTHDQKKQLRTTLKKRTKKDILTGCLIWQGAVATQSRYGVVGDPRTRGKRPSYVHHVAAELAGKIKPNHYAFDGSHEWQLHHGCRRRLCCNPSHLTWLTSKQHSAEHANDRHALAATRRALKVAHAAAMEAWMKNGKKGPKPDLIKPTLVHG